MMTGLELSMKVLSVGVIFISIRALMCGSIRAAVRDWCLAMVIVGTGVLVYFILDSSVPQTCLSHPVTEKIAHPNKAPQSDLKHVSVSSNTDIPNHVKEAKK